MEGHHQLPPHALRQRVLDQRGLDGGHDVGSGPRGEAGVEQGRQCLLSQMGVAGADVMDGQLGQVSAHRRAAPGGECPVEQTGGGDRVARSAGRLSPHDEVVDDVQVQHHGGAGQAVAGTDPFDAGPVGTEPGAQVVHVNVQRPAREGQRLGGPHSVLQGICADDLAAHAGQHRQQRPPTGATWRQLRPVEAHGHRPEEGNLEPGPRTALSCTS